MVEIADILEFWFGPTWRDGTVSDADRKRWWVKSPELDEEIRESFAETHGEIVAGNRENWLESAEGALAYVIVLDQFSRNMFRDSAAMYANDARATAAAGAAVEAGFDRQLSDTLRMFLYMPFMHAEDLAAQNRCVELFEALATESERFRGNVGYAVQHRDIVAEFGRFPHRNKILDRAMTPEEQRFLDEGGATF